MLMLTLRHHPTPTRRILPIILVFVTCTTLIGGLYLLALVCSPAIAPLITAKAVTIESLPAPSPTDNRVIIPKIDMNVSYATGASSLIHGAEWRHPNRGDPVKGGNFIITAHRFSIQPTLQETVKQSPFYHIDALTVGDKIIVDYLGTRYAYQINKVLLTRLSQEAIEAQSTTPELTLYTCNRNGLPDGHVILTATPLGEVALNG